MDLALARIFHTDSAAACEHLMDTASASNCSSGSMYSYSRRQTSSLALPHQPSQSPRHDQYEISGLGSEERSASVLSATMQGVRSRSVSEGLLIK